MKRWILAFILVVAAVLRLLHLGSIPPSLTPDEAALGYNAYSILKTGRDEYGKFMPIIFKSFGDYKPGFYIYLTVPSVAILGLNEFAVRFPSAVAGVFSVFLIYLIVKKLFSDEKLALIASFIAAINPWSVFFSRGAWEVNVALALTLAGIYFFFVSFERKKYLLLSIFFFALTLITYQGAKLSTGIVVVILLVLYWKEIVKFDKKTLFSGILVGVVVSIPIILSFFQGGTGRLEVFSVFSYPRSNDYIQAMLDEGGEKIGDVNYYLFHSESVNFLRGILGRFFNHFSPRFLFFEGDWTNAQHGSPYQGVLLLGDIIFLAAGVISLIRQKVKREIIFVWLWTFLSVLPAILSRDQVHNVRALNLSVPLIIILAFGAVSVLNLKNVWKVIIGLIYIGGFVYYLDSYFIHLPIHNSEFWQYGYKQIVETVTPIQGNYKTVRVQQSFAQPYIYFLFYQKYDPAKYQKQSTFISSGYKNDVGYITKLDNIVYIPILTSLLLDSRFWSRIRKKPYSGRP
jgi:4-amino-4-deoxy-L-arabinose transferase-like glycosyltransferase